MRWRWPAVRLRARRPLRFRRAVVALERNVVIRIAFVGDHPVIHKLIEAFNRFGRGRVPCRRFDSMAAARCFATLNF